MIAAQWIFDVIGEWWAAVLDELLHFQSMEGFLAWVGEFALLFPAGMCVVWMVFSLLYVLRRESRLPWSDAAALSVAVIVPARNEESGIAATIESLLAQDYPPMTIHVMSDASTDRTVERAREYEATHPKRVIVHDLAPRRGKAGALQHALDHIREDLFMVVDADTVCEPGAIRAMVQQFNDPNIAGVTGSPRVREPRGLLARIQAMEYIGIIGLIKRADSFWGGLFTVSGAAACFRSEALRAVGGWSGASVTEDIELSWRMQKAGYELAYEPRAMFRVEAPQQLKSLVRQRARWARGMIEVLLLHGNLAWTGNAALIPMAMQVVGTLLWMLCALATSIAWLVTTAAALAMHVPLDGETAMRVLGITSGLFVCQTVLACTWETHYRGGLWRHVPMALLFPVYYWVVIVPSFVIGVRSAIIARGKGSDVWEPTARAVAAEGARVL